MVVDEVGKGLPAAARGENFECLKPFFKAVRAKVGDVKPAFFMSDDAPAFWNAWTTVFGACETQKLLCSWHVHRNWKAQLRSKLQTEEERRELYTALCIRVQETSEEEFRRQAACLLTEAQELGTGEGSVHEYLSVHYFQQDRIRQWAAWARLGNYLQTCMLCNNRCNSCYYLVFVDFC